MHPQSTPHLWSAQEDQYLRDHFMTCTVAQMAACLGRTKPAVRTRKNTLRIGGKWRPWSADEVSSLRAHYAQHSGRALDLGALAGTMGRSLDALTLKAGELGLTDISRPRAQPRAWSPREDALLRAHRTLASTELAALGCLQRSARAISHRRLALGLGLSRDELRAVAARRWTIYPHPRGALGLHHTAQTRARISVASVAAWIRAKETGSGPMSEENVQRRSDLMALRQATDPRMRQGYSSSAGGTRADLGLYVRSRWEANVARYLKWLLARGDIHAWAYESRTFWFEHIKRGTRSYTPDFEIIERPGATPHFWEVKGWQHPRGQTALARMARYYPEVQITVIDEEAYRAIAKWKVLIPGWEQADRASRE